MELPVLYERIPRYKVREVREEYIRLQQGLCMYCESSLEQAPPKEVTDKPIKWSLFPPNFLKYPVHLQHCHNSGLTEGAVHAYCNAVLWQYHNR